MAKMYAMPANQMTCHITSTRQRLSMMVLSPVVTLFDCLLGSSQSRTQADTSVWNVTLTRYRTAYTTAAKGSADARRASPRRCPADPPEASLLSGPSSSARHRPRRRTHGKGGLLFHPQPVQSPHRAADP